MCIVKGSWSVISFFKGLPIHFIVSIDGTFQLPYLCNFPCRSYDSVQLVRAQVVCMF